MVSARMNSAVTRAAARSPPPGPEPPLTLVQGSLNARPPSLARKSGWTAVETPGRMIAARVHRSVRGTWVAGTEAGAGHTLLPPCPAQAPSDGSVAPVRHSQLAMSCGLGVRVVLGGWGPAPACRSSANESDPRHWKVASRMARVARPECDADCPAAVTRPLLISMAEKSGPSQAFAAPGTPSGPQPSRRADVAAPVAITPAAQRAAPPPTMRSRPPCTRPARRAGCRGGATRRRRPASSGCSSRPSRPGASRRHR